MAHTLGKRQTELRHSSPHTQSGMNIDDEYESRSGRDNAEAKRSGDDQVGSQPERKKHRHTPEQIQEMEK